MRHVYFRLILGLVFAGCLVYCGVTGNLAFALLYLVREYPRRGTVLFSSHILESLCRNAGRVVVLDQGSLRQTFSGGAVNPETIREALGYAPPDR